MNGWTDLCSPAKLYLLFMMALVLFNMANGYSIYAMRNFVYMIFGTFVLWVLCAANMDFAAWGLLAFPLFFFIVLIALWVFDGILFTTSREYKHRRSMSREEPVLVTEYKCTETIEEPTKCSNA